MDITDDGVGLQVENLAGNDFANMESRMQSMTDEFKILPSETGMKLQFTLSLN